MIDIIMQREKTILEETMELLEERVSFFSNNRISAENVLTQQSAFTVRSISEIIPQLCRFDLVQTPLHLSLADIYLGREAFNTPLENAALKFILPPVSQGEDSITEEETFEPPFKWVANAIVDSAFLVTDKIEPKKVERGRVNPEWKGVVELLLFNVERRIHLRTEMAEFEEHLKSRFEKYPWIKHKKTKQIYYRGKPSILLRFGDETSASFAYFNLSSPSQREVIGQSCEVLRVTENRLKQKLGQEVTLVFRRLPSSMTKEALLSLLKVKPAWMEELIEIGGFKYTICKVAYLQEAFQIITAFQAKGVKEAKVNYHPKSAKKWKLSEQAYFEN